MPILLMVLAALFSLPVSAQIVVNGPYSAPPSWNQTIPVTERYLVLANFNQQAVLDRETALVWSRSPFPGGRDVPWVTAITACLNFKLGNRWGWRLPTAPEFASLFDGSGDSVLPAGHPFQGVDSNSLTGRPPLRSS
jgi:hypothetical protein